MKKHLKNRKGFTLIELIVVLLILGIMAAFAVPSYIGFVNKAKEDSLRADARVGLLAAQVVATRDSSITAAGIVEDDDFEAMTAECEGTFSGIELDGNRRVTTITYSVGTDSVTLTPGPGGS